MSLPLTFDLHGTLLKGAIGDIFAPNGIPLTIRLSGTMTYIPPREISCPIPINIGMSGTMRYSTYGALTVHLPMATAGFSGSTNIYGTINIGVPAKEIGFSGYGSALGQLKITLPVPYLGMSGAEETLGSLNISLPRKLFSGSGSANITGTLNVTVPLMVFGGTALNGVSGTMTISLPVKAIDFVGYSSTEGQLNISLPMFWIKLMELVAEYDSMVMNTKNQGLTIYDNYKFNSMCEFSGKHLGASPTGIHDLDLGSNDNGEAVHWNVKTGYLDMEQGKKKRLVEAWVSGKLGGDVKITVIQPDGNSYEYTLDGVSQTESGMRLKFGRGLRSKYLALNIEDIEGSSITLDDFKLHLMSSASKVR